MSQNNIRKFTGFVKETTFKPQAPDAFPRFSKAYGHITKADGRNCWTNIKAYAHHPNMDHPFKIKVGMYNKEGKAFMQVDPDEFLTLISDLYEWYTSNESVIAELIEKNKILQRNKAKRNLVEDILNKTDFSDPPEIIIDGINITQKSINREKEMVIRMLKVLPNSSNKEFIIADICKRLDELHDQNIDLTDISDDLEVLTAEQMKLNIKKNGGANSLDFAEDISDLFPEFNHPASFINNIRSL